MDEQKVVVRLMSPLGEYPCAPFHSYDAVFVVQDDLCASIVRCSVFDDSEVVEWTEPEIPLFAAFLLTPSGHGYKLTPHPTSICQYLDPPLDLFDAQFQQNALAYLRSEATYDDGFYAPTNAVHRPPCLGGRKYSFVPSGPENKKMRAVVFDAIDREDPVLLRGLYCLVKANTAWQYGDFRETACQWLWIALEASFQIVLRRLRASGIQQPSVKDASLFIKDVLGWEWSPERYFEEDYERRISAIHPANRFHMSATPFLIADDYYELNDELLKVLPISCSWKNLVRRRQPSTITKLPP